MLFRSWADKNLFAPRLRRGFGIRSHKVVLSFNAYGPTLHEGGGLELLADAELAEDLVEQIFRGCFADDFSGATSRDSKLQSGHFKRAPSF